MRFQRSTPLRVAAVVVGFGLAPISTKAAAPISSYSGVPFTKATPLGSDVWPSTQTDEKDIGMILKSLKMRKSGKDAYISPHKCDMGDQADEKKCLQEERGCMWTRMETRDPLKHTQDAKAHCLPCNLDDEEIPCWNPGAWVNGMQVTDCKMSCMHQQRIWQPEYACSDETGFISQSQCFDRGAKSGSKCMYISYTDKKGDEKGSCGPCALSGSGGWGCPTTDAPGPEEGSKVIGCLSQCDVICSGPPACPPTAAPPPPPPPPSPGIIKVATDADTMLSAPAPFAMPTANPYAIAAAAQAAAEKAGYKIGTLPPPKVYWPVIYYRQPTDYLFTTGPPPSMGPEVPSGVQTSMLQGEMEAPTRPREPLLRSLRRQSWGN